jgi:hypothetical protein
MPWYEALAYTLLAVALAVFIGQAINKFADRF